MPWRHDMEIDSVSYSDRTKEEGPAPVMDELTTGDIIELKLTDGDNTFSAELQFWVNQEDGEKAPYIAWRIDGQKGDYGVFDGHSKKIWLGDEEFKTSEGNYSFVELSEDWRDKIHWNDMFDRVWSTLYCLLLEQTGELKEEGSSADLVDRTLKSRVYSFEVESYWSDRGELKLQLWRPETCQTVFVATRLNYYEKEHVMTCEKEVIDKSGIIPDSNSDGIDLKENAVKRLLEIANEIRDEDIRGLEIKI